MSDRMLVGGESIVYCKREINHLPLNPPTFLNAHREDVLWGSVRASTKLYDGRQMTLLYLNLS